MEFARGRAHKRLDHNSRYNSSLTSRPERVTLRTGHCALALPRDGLFGCPLQIMKIDRQQFADNGFLILRNVVGPDQLETVRAGVERMIDNRRERAAQRRLPGDPQGGDWVASGQPRLSFDQDADAASAVVIEFLLGDTTLGVCRQLMQTQNVGPHSMACICSSESHDAGPAAWHRDVAPGYPAPLEGMIANMVHHGPSYLQWNIALYEDRVFWIVPGSHRRINTEQEDERLQASPATPLAGGIPVELGPGDGVVYTHLLLHWGSNYSRKRRRTIHPGYRPFDFASLPNVHWRHWEPGFFHHLSASSRQFFEKLDGQFLEEIDRFAATFRAVIEARPDAFVTAFERLHPSPHGRDVTLAMLTRWAMKFCALRRAELALPGQWFNERDLAYLGQLFSVEEAEILQRRLAPLDARLRLPAPTGHRGVQQGQSPYEPNRMPQGFTLDQFIAGWDGRHGV